MTATGNQARSLILHVVMPDQREQEYYIRRDLTIGRNDTNNIQIDDQLVERVHARVVAERSGALVLECQTDRGRLNVDGQDRERLGLVSGASFSIGAAKFTCKEDQPQVEFVDHPWRVHCPKCRGSLVDLPKSAQPRSCPHCDLSLAYFDLAKQAPGEQGFAGWLPMKVGPYMIRKFIAEGGMGIVLRGLNMKTDRFAAVKLLRPAMKDDLRAETRFQDEIANLKRFNHPNLVRFQDSGQDRFLIWLAMDWFDGKALERWLANARRSSGQQFSIERVGEIMSQVAAGLGVLHAQNVVHRDLKPSNILVGPDGLVKITDFGIAKASGGVGPSVTMTMAGTTPGTAGYMSPEQFEGRQVGPESDVFAFGVLWYELLTLRATVGAHQRARLVRYECPASWETLIERCLSYEKDKRPTLTELQTELSAVAEAAGPKTREGVPHRQRAAPTREFAAAGESRTYTTGEWDLDPAIAKPSGLASWLVSVANQGWLDALYRVLIAVAFLGLTGLSVWMMTQTKNSAQYDVGRLFAVLAESKNSAQYDVGRLVAASIVVFSCLSLWSASIARRKAGSAWVTACGIALFVDTEALALTWYWGACKMSSLDNWGRLDVQHLVLACLAIGLAIPLAATVQDVRFLRRFKWLPRFSAILVFAAAIVGSLSVIFGADSPLVPMPNAIVAGVAAFSVLLVFLLRRPELAHANPEPFADDGSRLTSTGENRATRPHPEAPAQARSSLNPVVRRLDGASSNQ